MICGWHLEVFRRRQPLCLVSTQRQGPEVAVPRASCRHTCPGSPCQSWKDMYFFPESYRMPMQSTLPDVASASDASRRVLHRLGFRSDFSPRPTCIWACRCPLTKQAGPESLGKQRGPGDLRRGSVLQKTRAQSKRYPPPLYNPRTPFPPV